MTTAHPGDGDDPAAGASSTRRRLGVVVGLVAVAVVAVLALVVGVLAFVLPHGGTTDPLGEDAPGLADASFRAQGCRYQPERGGLVVHFAVRSSDTGRFTVDVKAVTAEGADDLDVATQHVVRYTVPFYGGPTRREFDVVVPVSEQEYRDGYRTCRWDLNPPA